MKHTATTRILSTVSYIIPFIVLGYMSVGSTFACNVNDSDCHDAVCSDFYDGNALDPKPPQSDSALCDTVNGFPGQTASIIQGNGPWSWTCSVGAPYNYTVQCGISNPTMCLDTTDGGGGCFIADTTVLMADGSSKLIQDISVGDKLKAVDGVNTVLSLIRPTLGNQDIFSINDQKAFFTANHPFLTTDGWKSLDPATTKKEIPDLEVSKLVIGDILITDHGNVLVVSINSAPSASSTQLYNFELDGDHTYFANGFAVHNKWNPNNGCDPYTGIGCTANTKLGNECTYNSDCYGRWMYCDNNSKTCQYEANAAPNMIDFDDPACEQTPTPVNGICGSSNGQTLNTIPTIGLCNSGVPSTIGGFGPWTWSCLGSNGGSNSPVCNATQTTVPTDPTCPYCRPVLCKDQNGNVVADSFCTEPKPATEQYQVCGLPTSTYTRSSDRGQCNYSQTCEAIGSNPSLAQTELCQGLDTTSCVSPANILTCQLMSSTAGTQSTTNTCKDQNGNVVADSFCTQPAPAIQNQACGSVSTGSSINGQCKNTTNDIYNSSNPNPSDLCIQGTANNIVLGYNSSSLTWTCDGQNGGTSVSCEAAKCGQLSDGVSNLGVEHQYGLLPGTTPGEIPPEYLCGTGNIYVNNSRTLGETDDFGDNNLIQYISYECQTLDGSHTRSCEVATSNQTCGDAQWGDGGIYSESNGQIWRRAYGLCTMGKHPVNGSYASSMGAPGYYPAGTPNYYPNLGAYQEWECANFPEFVSAGARTVTCRITPFGAGGPNCYPNPTPGLPDICE